VILSLTSMPALLANRTHFSGSPGVEHPPHAGVDAPVHAPLDAGVHASPDAPVHPGVDALLHAPPHSPVDAGVHASLHAPPQTPLHAPVDAPPHAGVDAPVEPAVFRRELRFLGRCQSRVHGRSVPGRPRSPGTIRTRLRSSRILRPSHSRARNLRNCSRARHVILAVSFQSLLRSSRKMWATSPYFPQRGAVSRAPLLVACA
jgi:hypothetical protein